MTHLKKYQKGLTLIEAMVAMFVLTFGVLTLMVTQLRSIASVQEAANQTTAALAAQTLAEGMNANAPVIINDNRITRDYSLYQKTDAANCSSTENNKPPADTYSGTLTQAQNAAVQLEHFRDTLCGNMFNAQNIRASVCRGTEKGCSNSGQSYVIDIHWDTQVHDPSQTPQTNNPLDINDEGLMPYRYTLTVQE